MSALFIPLKREHFEAFRDGTKPNMEELRPEGPRWNARTCAIGRSVVLSLGYGKAQRLSGRIVGYRTSTEPTRTPAWKDCYGDRAGLAACIQIELDNATARSQQAHIEPAARLTRESGLKFLAGGFPIGTTFYTGAQLEEACRLAVQAVAAQVHPSAAPEGWSKGVESVAKMLAKKADDYAAEYGHDDMGGLSFGSGNHAEARREYHSSLIELEEEVRAMISAAPAAPKVVSTHCYGPDNPPRLRKPGESVQEYRASMGWKTEGGAA